MCYVFGFCSSFLRVFQLAAAFPDVFVPVASVHPYRRDAVAELEKCARQGAQMVKWSVYAGKVANAHKHSSACSLCTSNYAMFRLPNSMGINPSSPLCKPFYKAMKRLGLILLTHTGVEHSVVSWRSGVATTV
jgi:predicted TIM-barrel fold metal-dependent hydrolase